MNLPNKLTVMRLILVPVFMVILLWNFGADTLTRLIAAAVFAIASLTDMLDGKIARKYNLVTNFGKFLDPLADKFMVIAALMCLIACGGSAMYSTCLIIAATIVIFRELAVTSVRLLACGKDGTVIAANIYGKIKTCLQIAFVLYALVDPILCDLVGVPLDGWPHFISYVLMLAMTVMTVLSGASYIRSYWKYIGPES
ncbi:MAG: CDP-diacylglycerol--glycerol-3-phosphate 3-phosphatidyltransferase [Clostridia bacterium]|nr:CDP-diacylglycerol--glycerol-3-phosphate 3-phosphatidyltransferase [Clostridia bacterium]